MDISLGVKWDIFLIFMICYINDKICILIHGLKVLYYLLAVTNKIISKQSYNKLKFNTKIIKMLFKVLKHWDKKEWLCY